jgi:N-acyl homoserine lactone hydrolase
MPVFSPASIELTTNGKPVKLHLFSTGKIAGSLSSRWQPIWVLAIEHPEGIFLVDTGERAHKFHPFYKFDLERDDEVDRQLARIHIQTSEVKTIILTHRHFDHTDGLHHFPDTPVLHPNPKDLTHTCGPFTHARYLTKTKDLVVVATPGHTRDHCSVLLKTDTHHIFFGGDMAETREQLTTEKPPVSLIRTRRQQTTQSYAAVKAYAQSHPLILLLTHDPASGIRLTTLEPLPSSKTCTPPQ